MEVKELGFEGVKLFVPKRFPDDRGYFQELFKSTQYEKHLPNVQFLQDNLSVSHVGVIRGLHYAEPRAQGKLVMVLQGLVRDVFVDLRKNSSTFGKWGAELLSAQRGEQLWLPPGFAHGFEVLEGPCHFLYKCTDVYVPEDDRGIRFDSPALGVTWLSPQPILSSKDRALPTFEEVFGISKGASS